MLLMIAADCELAALTALMRVLTDLQIKYQITLCYFHVIHAIWAKASKLGLRKNPN